jgi:hypothetical protein
MLRSTHRLCATFEISVEFEIFNAFTYLFIYLYTYLFLASLMTQSKNNHISYTQYLCQTFLDTFLF